VFGGCGDGIYVDTATLGASIIAVPHAGLVVKKTAAYYSLTGYASLAITGNSVYKSRSVGLVYSITTHIPSLVILHTCMDTIQLRRCFRSTRLSLINIHVYISYHIVALVE
jgi:hypothetical protein